MSAEFDPQATLPLAVEENHSLRPNPLRTQCQVQGCKRCLPKLKPYNKRYRICSYHAKIPQLLLNGKYTRFCQQCGKFQPLSEFDGYKRSCRAKLALHNARRKKGKDVTEVMPSAFHFPISSPAVSYDSSTAPASETLDSHSPSLQNEFSGHAPIHLQDTFNYLARLESTQTSDTICDPGLMPFTLEDACNIVNPLAPETFNFNFVPLDAVGHFGI